MNSGIFVFAKDAVHPNSVVMRMHQLKTGDLVRIGEEKFSFIKTDGAYAVLQRKSGDTIFLWAATEVERTGDAYIIKKKPKKEK